MAASLSLFSTARSPLSGSDFEPGVTVDAGGGDLKAVIFFPCLSFVYQVFTFPPSPSLKRTLNYSFGEAVYVVWGVSERLGVC